MAQLKITDLPTDPNGNLSGVRRALVTVFGRCRGRAYRMELLVDTLETVIKAAKGELDELKEQIAHDKKVEAARKARDAKLAKVREKDDAIVEAYNAKKQNTGDSE